MSFAFFGVLFVSVNANQLWIWMIWHLLYKHIHVSMKKIWNFCKSGGNVLVQWGLQKHFTKTLKKRPILWHEKKRQICIFFLCLINGCCNWSEPMLIDDELHEKKNKKKNQTMWIEKLNESETVGSLCECVCLKQEAVCRVGWWAACF